MDAVKVDDAHRIRLKILSPGDYYEPEVLSVDRITLRRVPHPHEVKLMFVNFSI